MFIFSSRLLRIFFSILSLYFQPIKSITSPPLTKPKPTLDSSFSQAPTKRCKERYGSNSFVENALYTSPFAYSKSRRLFFFFFFFKNKGFFLKAEINQLLSLIIFLCELLAMPLILIINIDLLCCSNLELVLCLKLWKIRRSFVFVFIFCFLAYNV